MKKFNVENPEKVPPKAKDKFMLANNLSDVYYGLVLVDNISVIKCVCWWDFTAKKWCFNAGISDKKLLEYYIEI